MSHVSTRKYVVAFSRDQKIYMVSTYDLPQSFYSSKSVNFSLNPEFAIYGCLESATRSMKQIRDWIKQNYPRGIRPHLFLLRIR